MFCLGYKTLLITKFALWLRQNRSTNDTDCLRLFISNWRYFRKNSYSQSYVFRTCEVAKLQTFKLSIFAISESRATFYLSYAEWSKNLGRSEKFSNFKLLRTILIFHTPTRQQPSSKLQARKQQKRVQLLVELFCGMDGILDQF